MTVYCVNVTRPESPHGDSWALSHLEVRTSFSYSTYSSGAFRGLHHSLIVPKSHTHMSRGPSTNSRGVGVRVNPGGNTKESIALPASFYAHRLGVARLQSRMHQDPGVKVGTSYLYHAWGLIQPHRATFWFYLTPGHLQGRAQTSYNMPAPK